MNIIETKRLQLRSIREEDFLFLYKHIFSDSLVMKYAFNGKIFSMDETRKFIDNYFAKENEEVGLAVCINKQTKMIVGFAGLLRYGDFTSNNYEIGFIFSKEVWGYGYVTEIGKAQIEYAITRLKAKNIYALVSSENPVSLHVIEKLNFSYFNDMYIENRGTRRVYKYYEI